MSQPTIPDLYLVFDDTAFYLKTRWNTGAELHLYAAQLLQDGAPDWAGARLVEDLMMDEGLVAPQTAELAERTLHLAWRIEAEQSL